MTNEIKNEKDVEVTNQEENVTEEKEVPEFSPQEIEIKRLNCLNLRLRIGMLQVGMESMQKDLQNMNRELAEQREKLSLAYPELKKIMDCPEDHEINLENGAFVPTQQNPSLVGGN